jgi:hypothetical protein
LSPNGNAARNSKVTPPRGADDDISSSAICGRKLPQPSYFPKNANPDDSIVTFQWKYGELI